MKKIYMTILAAVLLLGSGCTTGLLEGLGGLGGDTGNGTGQGGGLGDILGGVLGGVLGGLGGNTVDGLLGLVIGSVQVNESELYGAWCYSGPGCAFTSENLLAKAGGAVAAETCKEKLLPVYNTLGISASIPLSGTYTYDPTNATIKIKTMLFSSNVYVTRTTRGLAFTFESKNLLKVLQAVAAVSGNTTLQTVGDLSKQFDGVRLGFDMAPMN